MVPNRGHLHERRIVATTSGVSGDGRNMRATRTHDAIAASMTQLIQEGHIEPTALEVAKRANVSVRTIFVHFANMESLYAEIVRRQTLLVMPLLIVLDCRRETDDKALELIAIRDAIYSRAAPLRNSIRCGAAVRESETIRSELQRLREAMAAQVQQSFREELLLQAEPHQRASRIEAVTSFEMWDHLHRVQGIARGATRAQMLALLRAELTTGVAALDSAIIPIDGLAAFGA